MHNLPEFKLEHFLEQHEFNAPYMVCGSDIESWAMHDIVKMADLEMAKIWNNLSLSYTEPSGHPLLLNEVAQMYSDAITPENVFCFAGAEEGIYASCHALLEPKDHAIVVTPCYQSLQSIPQSICEVTTVELNYDLNWELDLEVLKQAVKPNTKLLLINYPHNPTGAVLSKSTFDALICFAREHDIWIFSDEVYRFLELDESDRLPPVASVYEKGVSLGVMSKAFGLPGLRIGWVTTQNKKLLDKMRSIKHYLSICNSAPSEILATIALRNKDVILNRNVALMKSNIILLDSFFNQYNKLVEWVRPKGGCIGFVKLKQDLNVNTVCNELLQQHGVLILPGDVYDMTLGGFRIGFGRANLPDGLLKLQQYFELQNI